MGALELNSKIFDQRKVIDDEKEINHNYCTDDVKEKLLTVIYMCKNEISTLTEELKKNNEKISILEFDLSQKEKIANQLSEDAIILKKDNVEMQGQLYVIKTIKDQLIYTNIEFEKKIEFLEGLLTLKDSDVSSLQTNVENLNKIIGKLRNQSQEEKDVLSTKLSIFENNSIINFKKI